MESECRASLGFRVQGCKLSPSLIGVWGLGLRGCRASDHYGFGIIRIWGSAVSEALWLVVFAGLLMFFGARGQGVKSLRLTNLGYEK